MQPNGLESEESPAVRRGRDIAALALMALGALGFTVTLFLVHPLAAAAALSLLVAGFGAFLALEPE